MTHINRINALHQWQTEDVWGAGRRKSKGHKLYVVGQSHEESWDIFIVKRGHFTVLWPLEGHPREHLHFTFIYLYIHSYFIYHRGVQQGTITASNLPVLWIQCQTSQYLKIIKIRVQFVKGNIKSISFESSVQHTTLWHLTELQPCQE